MSKLISVKKFPTVVFQVDFYFPSLTSRRSPSSSVSLVLQHQPLHSPFLPSAATLPLAVVIPLLMCEYQLGKRGREEKEGRGGRIWTEDNCVEALGLS